jgi:hypothetical protein
MHYFLIIFLLVQGAGAAERGAGRLFEGWSFAVVYLQQADDSVVTIIVKDDEDFLSDPSAKGSLEEFKTTTKFGAGEDMLIYLVHFDDGRQISRIIRGKSSSFLEVALDSKPPKGGQIQLNE